MQGIDKDPRQPLREWSMTQLKCSGDALYRATQGADLAIIHYKGGGPIAYVVSPQRYQALVSGRYPKNETSPAEVQADA